MWKSTTTIHRQLLQNAFRRSSPAVATSLSRVIPAAFVVSDKKSMSTWISTTSREIPDRASVFSNPPTRASLATVATHDDSSENDDNHRSDNKSIPDDPPKKQELKSLWETYLSTGRGAKALFFAIAAHHTGTSITASQLDSFLQQVLELTPPNNDSNDYHRPLAGGSTISPHAWDRLQSQPDATLSLNAFQKWLVAATKMSPGMNNVRMMQVWQESHPAGSSPFQPSSSDDDDGIPEFTWTEDTMSQSLRRMQYAVRGEIVMRADQLAQQGKSILYTNIGNPHQVGQKPITYYRQVLALCDLPAEEGVDHPDVERLFPSDVVQQAREYRDIVGTSGTGAYTHSQGLMGVRKHVAEFIQKRDGGYPSYPGNIFLTNGASSGIGMVLEGLLGCNRDAVMIPIPQYPIYSALIAKLGGRQVGYYLDESMNWSVSRDELERQYEVAVAEGLQIKALAMINPGNPSGNVMTHSDIQVIAEFCAAHGIVMMADEVYQANVYAPGSEFVSAKKVAMDCQLDNLQLVSFHSTSKGLIGECGRRGGYMELHHIDPYVQSQLYKLASSNLCAGTAGQLMTSLMVRPPQPDAESYPRFQKETSDIFHGLKERSEKLVAGLNSIPGISCVPAQGAMYAFPQVQLPPKAFAEARKLETTPDKLYAMSLLEETGICVVPASGFGQTKGRVGFRTTFLHPRAVDAIEQFAVHHKNFVQRYS